MSSPTPTPTALPQKFQSPSSPKLQPAQKTPPLGRSKHFDSAPLPNINAHALTLSHDTSEILDSLTQDQVLLNHMKTLQNDADHAKRQLNLLSERVDQSVEALDTLEVSVLPLLVDKCQDLEKMFRNIDQLYALVSEINYSFDTLEQRCTQIEQVQGSSASVRKQMGMFFRNILAVDLKKEKPKLPQADCAQSVPDFGLYINRNYVSEDEIRRILAAKEEAEAQQKLKDEKDAKLHKTDGDNDHGDDDSSSKPASMFIDDADTVADLVPENATRNNQHTIVTANSTARVEPSPYLTPPQSPLASGEEPEDDEVVEYVEEEEEVVDGEEPED